MRVLFINYEAGFGSYSGGISSYIKNKQLQLLLAVLEAFILEAHMVIQQRLKLLGA